MLDEAYTRFLKSLGLGEMGFGEHIFVPSMKPSGQLFIQGHLHEMLSMEIGIGEISKKSFRVFHRITAEGRVISLAEVGAVCFDYKAKQCELPHAFIEPSLRTSRFKRLQALSDSSPERRVEQSLK